MVVGFLCGFFVNVFVGCFVVVVCFFVLISSLLVFLRLVDLSQKYII